MADQRGNTEEKKNDSFFKKVLWGIAGAVGVAALATGATMVAKNAMEKLEAESLSKKELVLVVVNNTKNLDISKITTGMVDVCSSDEATNVHNSILVRTTTNHVQSRVEHNQNTGDLVVIIFYLDGEKDQFRIESIFTDNYRFEAITKTNDIDFIRKSKTTFQVTIKDPNREEENEQRNSGTLKIGEQDKFELAAKYNEEGKLLLNQAFETELDKEKALEAKNLFYEAIFKFEKALALNPIKEYTDHIRLTVIKLDGMALINDAKQLEEMADRNKKIGGDSVVTSNRHALEKYNEAKEKFLEGLKTDKRFERSLQLVDEAIEQLKENLSAYGLNNTQIAT